MRRDGILMMSEIEDSAQEEILRRFENETLDNHHESLQFWNCPRDVAIYSTLAVYDSFLVVAPFLSHRKQLLEMQFLKSLEEGFSQMIRWVYLKPGNVGITSTSNKETINTAGEFFHHAVRYIQIADMHRMYSRGQLRISVSEKCRTVRFMTPKEASPGGATRGQFEICNTRRKAQSRTQPGQVSDLVASLKRKIDSSNYQLSEGRILLLKTELANSREIVDFQELIGSTEPFQLDPDQDLGGFLVRDFCGYFKALQRWSCVCITIFQNLAFLGVDQFSCIPSQIVPYLKFRETMSAISGLEIETVLRITERLSYSKSLVNPDIYLQPLVCENDCIAWSVSAVLNSKYIRNMLKLMSRLPEHTRIASNIIGSREHPMLRQLGDQFSRLGKCDYKLFTKIMHEDLNAELDMIVYSKQDPHHVLLVEGKAVLGVDEINEVDAATRQMIEGQKQIERTVAILKSMPNEKKKSIFKFVNWEAVTSYNGVVVTIDSEPHDGLDQSKIPAISLETIYSRLKDKHFKSTVIFYEKCRDRPWLENLGEFEEDYEPFLIGDVTYELPVFAEKKSPGGPDSRYSGYLGTSAQESAV